MIRIKTENNKRTKKPTLFIARCAAAMLSCVLLISSLSACSAGKKGSYTARVVVDCEFALSDESLSEEKKELLPKDGILLDVPVNAKEGEKAEKLIVRALKKEKLQFENDGGYFSGISNLYEGDCGEYSGWMFYVNGKLADTGVSSYSVEEYDVISLLYVTDYRPLFE